MPRLIRRNRTLRKLDTAVLVEWLATARKRGYAGAVLSLELELSARHVFDVALPEPSSPGVGLLSTSFAAGGTSPRSNGMVGARLTTGLMEGKGDAALRNKLTK